jgi:hypothetical protein
MGQDKSLNPSRFSRLTQNETQDRSALDDGAFFGSGQCVTNAIRQNIIQDASIEAALAQVGRSVKFDDKPA